MQRSIICGDAGAAAEASGSRTSLGLLPTGSCGRIASAHATSIDLERLEVMGLCAGRVVEVVKAGDPMIVRVLGTRLGLAASLAREIHVVPVPNGLD